MRDRCTRSGPHTTNSIASWKLRLHKRYSRLDRLESDWEQGQNFGRRWKEEREAEKSVSVKPKLKLLGVLGPREDHEEAGGVCLTISSFYSTIEPVVS